METYLGWLAHLSKTKLSKQAWNTGHLMSRGEGRNGRSSGLSPGRTPLPEASFKINILNIRLRLMGGLVLCKICEFSVSRYFNVMSLGHELIMIMMWLVRRNSESFAPKSGLLKRNSIMSLSNVLSWAPITCNLHVLRVLHTKKTAAKGCTCLLYP